jgi:hypothetical protein
VVDVRIADGLLGRHVRRRADGEARLRNGAYVERPMQRFGDAKIRDDSVPLTEQNVFRFDVTVDDAVRVCARQRVGDLDENRNRVSCGHRAIASECLPERLALDERHDEKGALSGGFVRDERPSRSGRECVDVAALR